MSYQNQELSPNPARRSDFVVGLVIFVIMGTIAWWATVQTQAPKPVEEDIYADTLPNYPW